MNKKYGDVESQITEENSFDSGSNLYQTYYSNRLILKRLIRNYIGPYKAKVAMALCSMVIVALCSAAVVKLVQPTIDQIFLTHDRTMLVWMPIIMLCVFVVKGIAEYIQSYLILCIGQNVLTNLQIEMYKHLLFADMQLIHSQSSGRLISRFTNDIALMRGSVSHMLVSIAKHSLSVIFLITLMFDIEPILSSIVLFAFPAAVYPVQIISKKKRLLSSKVQSELGNYTAKLDETFQSIKIIKSFICELTEAKRAEKIALRIMQLYKRTAKFDSITSPIMELLNGIFIAIILWYGGFIVISGATTPGALFAFITAFISAYRPFKSLLSLNVNLQEGIAAANRVFNLLDTKPKISDKDDAIDVTIKKPYINFHDIELCFGRKTSLKDLSMSLENDKIYGFVGKSGSGKTSLANLLIRFYDPQQGTIKINDVEIKDIKLNSLRKQISFVTQDILLFNSTIFENIAYGCDNASFDDVIEASKNAHAHEFIESLPEGYDTKIGTQGFTLSGGQRQRLAIARAFLKNAPILILDEATSALDSEAESIIVKSLAKYKKDRIIIVITHRLSSIKHVDQIFVMKSGKVIEQGTHKELLNNDSEYSKLYIQESRKNK